MTSTPAVVGELLYSLTTRLPISCTLRLGPLDDNSYLLWQDLLGTNFRDVASVLYPVYGKANAGFYHHLEMARQMALHGQDPNWIFEGLRTPVTKAWSTFARPDRAAHCEPVRVSFTKLGPEVYVVADQTDRLRAPADASAVLDFPDSCKSLLDALTDYELGLQHGDHDSEELSHLENLLMEQRWCLSTLLEFYVKVIQQTKHPGDLKSVAYSAETQRNYCYHMGYHTDYDNRVQRDVARGHLRLQ